MAHKIAVIPGDGIGPEIVKEAQKVLNAAASYGRGCDNLKNVRPHLSHTQYLLPMQFPASKSKKL